MVATGATDPNLSEAAARRLLIDPRLRAAGWVPRPLGPGIAGGSSPAAVIEYPTANGPADYLLFANGRPLAVVEAKRPCVGVQEVLTQAERYVGGLDVTPFSFDGLRVPFVYSTNGETIRRSRQNGAAIFLKPVPVR